MLVAAPGGFAPVQAPPPPVLANGCSPAQNNPPSCAASFCLRPLAHLEGPQLPPAQGWWPWVLLPWAARGLAPEPGLSVLSRGTAPAGCVGRAEPSCWGLLPAPDLQAPGKKARSLVEGPEGALGDQTGRRKLLA